ncbi:hypothetical protein MMC08_002799 [Hypocenomyce scalaris]|nr:hypothetical protein [Hypocenomyce scalaris]
MKLTAHRYWEAKLAPGHVPSEAKIENFIRTKYESKRWVMDGPIPDPATLDDEGDDDVPLNLIQEKAKLERSSSQRVSSVSSQPARVGGKTVPVVDLFGDDAPIPPARPSTTDIPGKRPPPSNPTAPPKQSKPDNSLLGLDFFGTPNSAPPTRSASSASNPLGSSGPSRPDLKQSILSLYASKPPPASQPQHDRQASFGGIQSPLAQQPSNFGGLDDAFSGLSFASPISLPAPQPQQQQQQQPKPSPFANSTNPTTQRATAAAPQVTPHISGGGFFDTGPKPPPKPVTVIQPPLQSSQVQRTLSSSSGFGGFSSAPSISPLISKPAAVNGLNDMFDFSSSPPAASRTVPPAPVPTPVPNLNSAFNLSAPTPPSLPTQKPTSVAQSSTSAFSAFSNTDAWGSNDAWASPDPSTTAPKPKPLKSPAVPSAAANEYGWEPISSENTNNGFDGFGGFGTQPTPKIAADEDFGGWASAAPVTPAANPPSQPGNKASGGFGGSDDLFSNVWE